MKISKEVKVGAVALLTILAFIWLFNFLKGKDYFSKTVSYFSVYDQIGGLAESSPVEINGYKVGVVQSVEFIDAVSGKLLVEFSVSKDFKLPVNTFAEITPVSIIAGMKVQFIYGDGPGTYSYGDTIPGRIDEIVGSRETELKTTLDNLSRFSNMLSENSGAMGKTLNNLESITDTLAAADIYTSVTNLKKSLGNTSALLNNLNEGKGSAGKLLTNDTLYENLSGTLESLNILLQDMKENPKRYVHFSLFGKKNIPAE